MATYQANNGQDEIAIREDDRELQAYASGTNKPAGPAGLEAPDVPPALVDRREALDPGLIEEQRLRLDSIGGLTAGSGFRGRFSSFRLRFVWPISCIYKKFWAGKMNNIIENKEQQFANGQVRRNLGVNSEATEPEAEFETVNVIEQRLDVAAEEFPAPIGKLLGLMITSSGTGRATVDFEASGR